ncbi:hypothetical protein [Rhodococcus sp. 14-2496-1d]|uniref:hypothetical protein n=1 Tax=Rhodococcus sp. 14-2496-1d TaxID=2023146 RepID=UPI0015C68876|nr:hypothetical protein [Rhodococcus sp. 14-2496-1d]
MQQHITYRVFVTHHGGKAVTGVSDPLRSAIDMHGLNPSRHLGAHLRGKFHLLW